MPPREGNDVGCNRMPAARGKDMKSFEKAESRSNRTPAERTQRNYLVPRVSSAAKAAVRGLTFTARLEAAPFQNQSRVPASCGGKKRLSNRRSLRSEISCYMPSSLLLRVRAFNSCWLILILPDFSI